LGDNRESMYSPYFVPSFKIIFVYFINVPGNCLIIC